MHPVLHQLGGAGVAVLIHHGSSESKDGDERMEAALRRIEQRLDEMDGKTSKS